MLPTVEPKAENRAPSCVTGDTTSDPNLAPRKEDIADVIIPGLENPFIGFTSAALNKPDWDNPWNTPFPAKMLSAANCTTLALETDNNSPPNPVVPRTLPSSNVKSDEIVPAAAARKLLINSEPRSSRTFSTVPLVDAIGRLKPPATTT
ncbi:hypothetical protein L6Q21_14160 [Sandaracinobacter sp. RS1-74]|uniref:hypothetical protein n=1 Tax=Sandaracinobacteroides sayramensis TaxID=2913411 RepID=UPI001EDC8C06|nr:hypothetical protein [Sandaracinobacteroides sayramensis]MCG2842129.1 hypothetical protein [Sandaracinobacteroides sayramensis]